MGDGAVWYLYQHHFIFVATTRANELGSVKERIPVYGRGNCGGSGVDFTAILETTNCHSLPLYNILWCPQVKSWRDSLTKIIPVTLAFGGMTRGARRI